MRRILVLAMLVSLLIVPAPVVAAADRCSIDVTPSSGTGSTVYRISGKNFPAVTDGRILEVRIDVRRLGSREGAILLLFLIPGGTEFYVDYNEAYDGGTGLTRGRYLVTAQTPHVKGCHTTDRFVVR